MADPGTLRNAQDQIAAAIALASGFDADLVVWDTDDQPYAESGQIILLSLTSLQALTPPRQLQAFPGDHDISHSYTQMWSLRVSCRCESEQGAGDDIAAKALSKITIGLEFQSVQEALAAQNIAAAQVLMPLATVDFQVDGRAFSAYAVDVEFRCELYQEDPTVYRSIEHLVITDTVEGVTEEYEA